MNLRALTALLGLGVLSVGALALGASPAAARGVTGCDAFGTALAADASELGITLNHSVVVSRAEANANVFDVATNGDVDGTLTCAGDKLERFESRVTEPASCARQDQLRQAVDGSLARRAWLRRRQGDGFVQPPGCGSRGIFEGLARARRRLHLRQDRRAPRRRRKLGHHRDRHRPRLHHRRRRRLRLRRDGGGSLLRAATPRPRRRADRAPGGGGSRRRCGSSFKRAGRSR